MHRRQVLALVPGAGLVAALAACTGSGSDPPIPGGPDDPDDPVRATVSDSERALISRYDATLTRHPDLAPTLATLRDQHQDHLAAVAGPDATAAAATDASATAAAVPATATGAVRALAAAERAAAKERGEACEAAAGAELARLLALVAASEAGHAAYLQATT